MTSGVEVRLLRFRALVAAAVLNAILALVALLVLRGDLAHALADTRAKCALEDLPIHLRRATLAVWEPVPTSTLAAELAHRLVPSDPGRLASQPLRARVYRVLLGAALSRDEILSHLLARTPVGALPGRPAQGLGEAASRVFGRPCSLLTVGQVVLLNGLARNPHPWAPHGNSEPAIALRDSLLWRLRETGEISEKTYRIETGRPLSLRVDHIPIY